MPYHATISIYGFDIFNKPLHAHPTELLKGVSMKTAKTRAHQKATTLGLTPVTRQWVNVSDSYAKREYQGRKVTEDCVTHFRRLIVVERS